MEKGTSKSGMDRGQGVIAKGYKISSGGGANVLKLAVMVSHI